MEKHTIVILASARPESNTRKLVHMLFPAGDANVLDLLDFRIHPYSYSGEYPTEDEYLQLIKVILPYNRIVFATPVYWYAMSGLLKTFFDRLTDIVTVEKSLGRKLAGKDMFLVAVGSDKELPPGFEKPFELTATYFDMEYKGSYYCSTKEMHLHSESRNLFMAALRANSKL